MGVLKLFSCEEDMSFQDKCEIVASFALNNSNKVWKEKTRYKMDMLTLVDVDEEWYSLMFKTDELSMRERFLGESDLKDIIEEHIDDEGNIRLVEFDLDDNGDVFVNTVCKSIKKTSGRSLRRFFLVDYEGDLFLTDIKGLNKATLHYKDKHERNKLGLQFEDIMNRFM